ncbi:MAG: hypothetical protein JO301_00885 [Chitinophagaceae bacterium]|nr:hypothetical protein [Chitinophagaceae bacterium]
MKTDRHSIFISVLAILLLAGCAGSTGTGSPVPNDTQFLLRTVSDTMDGDKPYHVYHAIYVEKDRSREPYRVLADFRYTPTENLSDALDSLKARGAVLKKTDTYGLPAEWVPLYRYKGQYYVYQPSEAGNLCRRILSDSLLVFWFMDEPMPYVLNKATKLNDSTFQVLSTDYLVKTPGFIRPEILNIYIIDKTRRIAVWEYKARSDTGYHYELVIPKSSIPLFDMIVNYSPQEKAGEFDFDSLSFPQLLRNRRLLR